MACDAFVRIKQSSGRALDVRSPRALVRRRPCLINLRFEVSRLFDQDSRKIVVVGQFGEFEKRCCLTREIVPADHRISPLIYLCTKCRSPGFVPAKCTKVNLAASVQRSRRRPLHAEPWRVTPLRRCLHKSIGRHSLRPARHRLTYPFPRLPLDRWSNGLRDSAAGVNGRSGSIASL